MVWLYTNPEENKTRSPMWLLSSQACLHSKTSFPLCSGAQINQMVDMMVGVLSEGCMKSVLFQHLNICNLPRLTVNTYIQGNEASLEMRGSISNELQIVRGLHQTLTPAKNHLQSKSLSYESAAHWDRASPTVTEETKCRWPWSAAYMHNKGGLLLTWTPSLMMEHVHWTMTCEREKTWPEAERRKKDDRCGTAERLCSESSDPETYTSIHGHFWIWKKKSPL